MERGNKKTCKICNLKITKDEEMIYASMGKVHIDCYRQRLVKRYNDKVVEEKINHLIEKTNLKIEERLEKEKMKNETKLKNVKDKLKNKEFKDKFYEYIQSHYDCNLTTYFFTKVSNIVNGTFKGLKEGISYEDLLYMFKTKQKELDRIAYDKNRKGNGFTDSLSRLNFDLAVIVNKYDSYKKWKEKQKLLQVNNDDIKNVVNNLIEIDFSKINRQTQKGTDINDILDEVF